MSGHEHDGCEIPRTHGSTHVSVILVVGEGSAHAVQAAPVKARVNFNRTYEVVATILSGDTAGAPANQSAASAIANCKGEVLVVLCDLNSNEYQYTIGYLSNLINHRQSRLRNVTIINRTAASAPNVVPAPYIAEGVPVFRKVMNLIRCDYDCWNALDHSKLKPGRTMTVDSNGGKALIRYVQTIDELGSEYNSTWWVTAYFSTPPCAYGRLTQVSGTCWFNAAINALLLSETLSQMVGKHYRGLSSAQLADLERDRSANACPMEPKGAVRMALSVYHHVIAHGRRFDDPDDDVVVGHATGQKHTWGDTLTLASTIARLFGENHVMTMSIPRRRDSEIFTHMQNHKDIDVIAVNNERTGHASGLTVETTLTVNNREFELEAAVLTLRLDGILHVVACLKCNGVPYVFDSNNLLVETDWPSGDFVAYGNACESYYGHRPSEYLGYPEVIYVRRGTNNRYLSSPRPGPSQPRRRTVSYRHPQPVASANRVIAMSPNKALYMTETYPELVPAVPYATWRRLDGLDRAAVSRHAASGTLDVPTNALFSALLSSDALMTEATTNLPRSVPAPAPVPVLPVRNRSRSTSFWRRSNSAGPARISICPTTGVPRCIEIKYGDANVSGDYGCFFNEKKDANNIFNSLLSIAPWLRLDGGPSDDLTGLLNHAIRNQMAVKVVPDIGTAIEDEIHSEKIVRSALPSPKEMDTHTTYRSFKGQSCFILQVASNNMDMKVINKKHYFTLAGF